MRMSHRPSRWARDQGINLTPLLDVIFNLIFFFLLATSLREDQALNIELSQSEEAQQVAAETAAVVVSITRENQIAVYGEILPLESLTGRLQQAKADGAIGAIIRADSQSYNQTLVDVWTALEKAGYAQTRVDVAPPRAAALP
jgi:biopolymer transport protein ExbD